MNVLLLGPSAERLLPTLGAAGDSSSVCLDPIGQVHIDWADFAVSFGYRHIVSRENIELLRGRIINIHISFLPWNRGADPNLWSFLEDTPKGVTIHFMDEGIDTGLIIAQRQIAFDEQVESLRSSYEKLILAATDLFAECWPRIRKGDSIGCPQPSGGSFHTVADKEKVAPLLAQSGYDTPVSMLVGRCRKPGGTE